MSDEVQRVRLPGQMILYAAHDEGAAMSIPGLRQFLIGQPMHSVDVRVGRARHAVHGNDRTGVCHAQEQHAGRNMKIVVDPDDMRGYERVARLLAGFPDRTLEQGLAYLQTTGWLIDLEGAVDRLFDEQEASVALQDRGDDDLMMCLAQG